MTDAGQAACACHVWRMGTACAQPIVTHLTSAASPALPLQAKVRARLELLKTAGATVADTTRA